eukprot:scaffold83769_cov26-Prasinocladus_malaysianus.AAC.1
MLRFLVSCPRKVRWWDMTEGRQVIRLDGHTDYVRAAECSPGSDTTWLTGSYDHTVRLWDVRSKEAVMEFQHGSPVEDVAFFPSGAVCPWGPRAGRVTK